VDAIEMDTGPTPELLDCWICGESPCVEGTDLCGECWAVVEDQEA
jgi:hypothetical protein